MRAASSNPAKMDKYFCFAILFSFALAGNGQLSGTGDTCITGNDCNAVNEICFELKESKCYCPIGFKGVDCKEPNTNIIDEKCELPESLPSVCKTALNLCGPSCPPGHICCSVGCAATCKSRDECTTTEDCPENRMCIDSPFKPNVCDCPFGYTGDDCTEQQDGIDDRCPYPDDLIDVCVTSQINFQCDKDNTCPDGETCCHGPDGCSTRCFKLECKTTAECPGNKICLQPQSRPNVCDCPFGFEGEDCMERQDGIDVRCPYPDDLIDLCVTSQVDVHCSEGNPCPDGEICCLGANGCSTNCIPIDPKPPRKKPNLALIALLLSTRRQRPPVAPAVSIVSVAPIYPVSPILPVAPVRCPPNRCVCSKNLGAICEPSIRGCGANIRDQHTRKLITPLCKCNPGYQIYSPCSKDKCLDMYGRRLVCPGHPNARCRVTQCGRCQAYWMDIYTGKQVTCQRRQPVNPGAACGPWEMPILRCPDICRHTKCPNYPYATCMVRACNGCTARYTHQGRDVTAGCNQVVG